MKPVYEVHVGNIGLVHGGINRADAETAYSAYVEISKAPYGRGSGESVTLSRNGEILREYADTRNMKESN